MMITVKNNYFLLRMNILLIYWICLIGSGKNVERQYSEWRKKYNVTGRESRWCWLVKNKYNPEMFVQGYGPYEGNWRDGSKSRWVKSSVSNS